jgi:hypothetical protein
MLISRRSALAYASAAGASAAASLPVEVLAAPTPFQKAQQVQHLVIHRDEGAGHALHVPIALSAPDTAWVAMATLTESALHTALRTYDRRSYGLRRINAFQTRAGIRYAALWQWGRAADTNMRHGMTAAEFEDRAGAMTSKGFAPVHIDAVATASGPRYAAIWEKASRMDKVFANLTATELQAQGAVLGADGYRAVHLAAHAQNGAARFAAVFSRTGGAVESDHAVPASEIDARSVALAARGLALRDANGYVVGRKPFIAAVWGAA